MPTVGELKKSLKAVGLAQTGEKPDLERRLRQHGEGESLKLDGVNPAALKNPALKKACAKRGLPCDLDLGTRDDLVDGLIASLRAEQRAARSSSTNNGGDDESDEPLSKKPRWRRVVVRRRRRARDRHREAGAAARRGRAGGGGALGARRGDHARDAVCEAEERLPPARAAHPPGQARRQVRRRDARVPGARPRLRHADGARGGRGRRAGGADGEDAGAVERELRAHARLLPAGPRRVGHRRLRAAAVRLHDLHAGAQDVLLRALPLRLRLHVGDPQVPDLHQGL